MYMEWLEHQAIATAPVECKPRLWKRYVDDVLEVIRKGTVCQLTDHLNTVDTTGSIKFTYEEEADGQIPFLDTLIVRKEDGSVKLLVYRKKTHTDQYLDFSSHHPLHQKLGVIRTLLDRCNSLVTEDKDREREEQHITKALQQCRYPTWAITQVKKDMQQKRKAEQKKEKQRKTTKEKSKGLVVIPYVKGLSETFTRIMREHGISTAIRPHRTLRNILVHPKDKVTDDKKSDVVYKIPCKNCEASYIGETGRTLGTRIKEHRSEVDSVTGAFTRAAKVRAESTENKSAITDHVASRNHVIDWEKATVVDTAADRSQRHIKEAVWIRKTSRTMNRDEGVYQLSHVWDYLLTDVTTGRKQKSLVV